METGAYNIVEDTQAYPRYATTMSIVALLRLAWREAAPPASEVTVTGSTSAPSSATGCGRRPTTG